MRHYNKGTSLTYAEPSAILFALGIFNLFLAMLSNILKKAVAGVQGGYLIKQSFLITVSLKLGFMMKIFLTGFVLMMITAIMVHFLLPDTTRICLMVKKRLFNYSYGNPLHLKEGERLPKVICKKKRNYMYDIHITTTSRTDNDIQALADCISASLNGKFSRYAVTGTESDIAHRAVRFRIEDVTIDRSLTLHSVDELKPDVPARLIIQDGDYIDLTTSGSMIFAGKTRSGKTTGVISLLLQVLSTGRDTYGSKVIIIDPKQAELSRLPYVSTLDENGEARGILDAMRHFTEVIKTRQKILNDISEKEGNAVHWWAVNMRPCILFIDEYVALRSIFPKRAGKDDSDYSLAEFDSVLKRILTMGASAGCFAIISIAEASVDEGGLPAMLKNACGTKILFKPTLTEGRFLWDSEKLQILPQRVYNAGDAWISSTDGVHDDVTYVHFPSMKFPIYRELGRLLQAYYERA